MEFMAECKDGQFDLAIPDPPYGINWDKEKESMSAGIRKDGSRRKYNKWNDPKPKKYKKGNYDDSIPDKKYFDLLFECSNRQIIWGGNYYTKYLEPIGGWVIWDKKVVMPTLSKVELAWTSFLGHTEIFRYLWAGYRKEKPENRIHVNQKPVALYKWLLKNYAQPGWTIFDSHVGSGSLRIACHDMGYDFVGCELDPDYWQAQEDRFKRHIKQPELWGKEEIQAAIYE